MEDRHVDREDPQSGLVCVQPPLVCTFHAIPTGKRASTLTRGHIHTHKHTPHTQGKKLTNALKLLPPTQRTSGRHISKGHLHCCNAENNIEGILINI